MKKAVSPVIATILLIALTIIIALIVFQWIFKYWKCSDL
ncbi:type IV pilin [Candidatus Pacearchaeota archaeon]|nr:type IV pilin [Candidatus Pacearchaeota archaeon]